MTFDQIKKMIIENPDALRSFLTNELSKITDAEPQAVARYIIAMLKKDRSMENLREFCVDQLDVFLMNETKAFVDLLFETLETKSYLTSLSNTNSTGDVSSNDSSSAKVCQANSASSAKFKRSVSSTTKTTQSEKEYEKKEMEEKCKEDVGKSLKRPVPMLDEDSLAMSKKIKTDAVCEKHSRQKNTLANSSAPNTDTDFKSKNLTNESSEEKSNEKGYCIQGDFCRFDHGSDPILIEGARAYVFDDFEDSLAKSKSPMMHSLLAPPPLPNSPPPLPPPLPPMLTPGGPSYVPEPYNPEDPGMISSQNFSYYRPSPVHRIPMYPTRPTGATSIETSTTNMHTMSFNIPSNFHQKPLRIRELIGVPTVGNIDLEDQKSFICQEKSDGHKVENKESYDHNIVTTLENEYIPKAGFDFNRLGPSSRKGYKENRSLLVRNIPHRFNRIAMLNNHFSKFGRVVNLKVAYDGDPEVALVEFLTNAEAHNAFRSPEAVFNNRFIKLFWHKDDKETNKESGFVTNEHMSFPTLDAKSYEGKVTSELDILNVDTKVPEKAPLSHLHTKVYTSKGPRTVFIPPLSDLKKVNFRQNRRFTEERLHLIRKKQDLLKSQLAHQKVVMEKLQECKKNEKEREFLKQTMDAITAKIISIQNDLKKETEDLKNMLQNTSTQKVPITKTEAEKALLDAEMDLYKKRKTGNDNAELLSRVTELKERAQSFGLIDNNSEPHFGWKKGHSSSVLTTHLTVDHRPRKFLVTGSTEFSLDSLSEESLRNHFMQFGDVEKVEADHTHVNSYVITFGSRVDAESAYARATKLGDNVLSFSWIHDPQNAVKPSPLEETDTSEIETLTSQMFDDDEEEEEEDDDEEDSEARSWRR